MNTQNQVSGLRNPSLAAEFPDQGRAPRIFYVAGPGAVAVSYRHWREGSTDPHEVALTYLGQFCTLCHHLDADAYVVSSHPEAQMIQDGPFRIEHRPDPRIGLRGLRYHLAEMRYSLGLVASAQRYGTDVALIGGGWSHLYVFGLLALFGVRVVPTLHCTIWPKYRAPRGLKQLLNRFNGQFLRRSSAVLCVSEDVARQVRVLTRGRGAPIETFLPGFQASYFEDIETTPSPPFRVLYIGRIERDKGVFDLLEVCRRFVAQGRHDIEFDLCGSGGALDELRRKVEDGGLSGRFRLHGHCDRGAMCRMYGAAHAVIVPTTTAFVEGFNKVVAEAVLARIPVITSSVCPALEYVRDAAVEVAPDDVAGYGDAILRLADDPIYFAEKQRACRSARVILLDQDRMFQSVVERVLAGMLHVANP